jgi:hypothetical protein
MDSPTIRPALLTALCFLTFMSSVSGLWNQSQGLWNPGIVADQVKEKFEALYEQLEQTQSKEERKMVDQMFESVISRTDASNIKTISLIMIVFESMTLFAAYLMWNLDKRGFYLYLAAVGLTFIAPMLLVGGMLGFIMALSGTFFSFFMCLFYAAHLKYMH